MKIVHMTFVHYIPTSNFFYFVLFKLSLFYMEHIFQLYKITVFHFWVNYSFVYLSLVWFLRCIMQYVCIFPKQCIILVSKVSGSLYFQCLLTGLQFVTEGRSEGICKLVGKPDVCGAHSDCMAGEGGLSFIPIFQKYLPDTFSFQYLSVVVHLFSQFANSVFLK